MSEFKERCVIHPEKGQVEINGKLIVLRPKTFELLQLLSNKPNEVFSKAQILAHIWADSVVEEQVIFQSINEIRKELGSNEVIKTYPRRGYAWNCTDTFISSANKEDKKSAAPGLFSSKTFMVSVFTICLILIGLTISIYSPTPLLIIEKQTSEQATASIHEGILILPIDVDALHESEKWIRFGAMQGLINKVQPNDNVTVFKLEDTIEILNRLSAEERSNISNIFNKSGASIVLQTSISGVPGDYNVVYSVFTPASVETKSLHVKTINTAIDELALTFNSPLGNSSLDNSFLEPVSKIDTKFINNKLQNDLIAKAIQYLEVNDYPSAFTFLKSAIASDKTNIYAHYLLAKVASRLGDVEQVMQSTQAALTLINDGADQRYKNRLLYIHGIVLLAKGNIDLAEQILLEAEQTSKISKDWLYFSYAQSMLGKLHQVQNNFAKAQSYFASALQYQELLQCPMGIAQSYLDITELNLAQHHLDKATQSFQKAELLIRQQKLQQIEPMLAEIENKMAQFHQTH